VVLFGDFWSASEGTVDLDPGAGEALRPFAAESDLYLLALDATTGDFVWGETWGGASGEAATGLAVDVAGKVYAGGFYASDPLDFDPGAGEDLHGAGLASDAYIVRYNAAGVYEGVRTWGGDGSAAVRDMTTDAYGNLLVVGEFDAEALSAIDFQTTGGEPWLLEVGDNALTFVAKYSRGFDFVWAYGMGGHLDGARSQVLVRPVGDILLIGEYDQSAGEVDLDPGAALLPLPAGAPERGTFLSSLDTDGALNMVQVLALPFVNTMVSSARNEVIIGGSVSSGEELAPVLPPCSAQSCPAPAGSRGAIVYFDPDLCW
jgi:hypothetical protein